MPGPREEAQHRRHFHFPSGSESPASGGPKLAVALAVLGVVYGDIGTSPIYALRTAFTGATPVTVEPANILGVLSLIFWTLVIVISIKYMIFVLRADNRGEGGTFALIALLRPWQGLERRRRHLLIMTGLFGAALLYGGVIITPSISILSAVEGLKVAEPLLARYVVPITIVILILLFYFQHKGTARVGATFGPVMTVWFLVIAGLGLASIVKTPEVLVALNPAYAIKFFLRDGWAGFLVLYAVFLVSTGGEALYADLGHFGRWPIRWVWFGFVLPALLLNYFGQGALVLRQPGGTLQPFYHLAPHWFLYPLVVLATAATIIASQAAITGSFSLTRQAIQLGLMPRFRVTQTSAETRGQIYVAAVNWVLMAATIGVVLMFRSSSALAAAYGAAVNGTMIVTTILAYNVAKERGGWPKWTALTFLAGFLVVDLSFFSSNVMKIPDGGWFPIVIGIVFFTIMSTWRRGSEILEGIEQKSPVTLETLVSDVRQQNLARVPGTAIFLTGRLENVPDQLRHHIRRNRSLQNQVILLTVLVEDVARIAPEKRIEVQKHDAGFARVILHYGYMQGVNVPDELVKCEKHDLPITLNDATYYVGRQTLIPSRREGGMVGWRDRLFAVMARNATDPTDYYHIPADQTVEVGVRIRI